MCDNNGAISNFFDKMVLQLHTSSKHESLYGGGLIFKTIAHPSVRPSNFHPPTGAFICTYNCAVVEY